MEKKLDELIAKYEEGNMSLITLKAELLRLFNVSGSLPSVDELEPFLYWIFHKADRIWVEHTLGWRKNAIVEMYEAYCRRKQ